MPRRNRPMKDVATRRNASGRRWQPAIRRCPNGATPLGDTRDLLWQEGTGGTETSHVPRGTERIPVVAASEPGGAQTTPAYEAAAAAGVGLNEMLRRTGRDVVRTLDEAERRWNGRPERVRVP
jgi:hypothetical protein